MWKYNSTSKAVYTITKESKRNMPVRDLRKEYNVFLLNFWKLLYIEVGTTIHSNGLT